LFNRITLGVNGDTNLIKSRLYNHPECAFPISVAKAESAEPITYISFDLSDDLLTLDKYLTVVAEYIIERYETRMIRRILEEKYSDLSIVQKREIMKNIFCYTDDSEFGYNARKQAILLSVYDYFNEESLMLIDGFVTFRLKEYEALLDRLTERLVEDYITHKEYEEFIELLRYFVSMQQTRPELIHVCVRPDSGYAIIDEAGQDITARCFSDFAEGELLLTEEAYDDLLISVLITLAPQKILIHNASAITNHELFDTIDRVFQDGVSRCDGCTLCENKT